MGFPSLSLAKTSLAQSANFTREARTSLARALRGHIECGAHIELQSNISIAVGEYRLAERMRSELSAPNLFAESAYAFGNNSLARSANFTAEGNFTVQSTTSLTKSISLREARVIPNGRDFVRSLLHGVRDLLSRTACKSRRVQGYKPSLVREGVTVGDG